MLSYNCAYTFATGISSFAQFLPLVLLSIKEEFMQDEVQFLNRDNDIHR